MAPLVNIEILYYTQHCTMSYKQHIHVYMVHAPLAPPEANREANVNGADIVPAPRRDVQHLPGMEEVLLRAGLGKLREPSEVWVLHIHLLGQVYNYVHVNYEQPFSSTWIFTLAHSE